MKKFLIVSAIVLAVFIAGAFIYAQYGSLPDEPEPHAGGPESFSLNLPEQNSKPADLLTAEKEGIQVVVEEVKRENGQAIIKLVMDNHLYDLGEFAVKELSSLDGVKASDYQISGDQVGGHHLEASLIFPGELFGQLFVGLKDDLRFEFEI